MAFTRMYLADAKDWVTEILEEEWGWRDELCFLVVVLDGAREFYHHHRTEWKEDVFRQHCSRIVATSGGKILGSGVAVADVQGNGVQSHRLADAVVAVFDSADITLALITAFHVKNRLHDFNETTEMGLKWQQQVHPRIVVGRNLRSALNLLPVVWRGDIYVPHEDWSGFDDVLKPLLSAAGVKRSTLNGEEEEIGKFVDNLLTQSEPVEEPVVGAIAG